MCFPKCFKFLALTQIAFYRTAQAIQPWWSKLEQAACCSFGSCLYTVPPDPSLTWRTKCALCCFQNIDTCAGFSLVDGHLGCHLCVRSEFLNVVHLKLELGASEFRAFVIQPIVGRMVHIVGYISTGTSKVTINFRYNSGLALHFDSRLGYSGNWHVVRNSLLDGSGWEQEETYGGQPFSLDTEFDLKFIVYSNQFQVLVDDQWFCSYAHHVPPSDITALEVRYAAGNSEMLLKRVQLI